MIELISQQALRKKYENAIDSFISKVKEDVNVIVVIVFGSYTYDVLREKSDVDMNIIVRDQKLNNTNYTFTEDGILINAKLVGISNLKGMQNVQSAVRFLSHYMQQVKFCIQQMIAYTIILMK